MLRTNLNAEQRDAWAELAAATHAFAGTYPDAPDPALERRLHDAEMAAIFTGLTVTEAAEAIVAGWDQITPQLAKQWIERDMHIQAFKDELEITQVGRSMPVLNSAG